eukprot:359793-Chlamydomonas_euryale.AAC.20
MFGCADSARMGCDGLGAPVVQAVTKGGRRSGEAMLSREHAMRIITPLGVGFHTSASSAALALSFAAAPLADACPLRATSCSPATIALTRKSATRRYLLGPDAAESYCFSAADSSLSNLFKSMGSACSSCARGGATHHVGSKQLKAEKTPRCCCLRVSDAKEVEYVHDQF